MFLEVYPAIKISTSVFCLSSTVFQMLFNAVGKEPTYSRLPVGIFDVSINSLQWLADVFKLEALENAAELGRIGKYYAVEDMVTTAPEEMYGTITLQEHFNRIAQEGQEYDPYTTMYVFVFVSRRCSLFWPFTDYLCCFHTPNVCFCFVLWLYIILC